MNKMFAKIENRKPTHIAHICNSHELTLKPKIAKECNLANTPEEYENN